MESAAFPHSPTAGPRAYVLVNGERCELLEDRRLALTPTYFPDGTQLFDPLFSPPREIPLSDDPAEPGVTTAKLRPYAHYYAAPPVTKPQCLTVHGLPEGTTAQALGQFFERLFEHCFVQEADVYCFTGPGPKRCNGRGYVLLQNPLHTRQCLESRQLLWDAHTQHVVYVEAMDWNHPQPPAYGGPPGAAGGGRGGAPPPPSRPPPAYGETLAGGRAGGPGFPGGAGGMTATSNTAPPPPPPPPLDVGGGRGPPPPPMAAAPAGPHFFVSHLLPLPSGPAGSPPMAELAVLQQAVESGVLAVSRTNARDFDRAVQRGAAGIHLLVVAPHQQEIVGVAQLVDLLGEGPAVAVPAAAGAATLTTIPTTR